MPMTQLFRMMGDLELDPKRLTTYYAFTQKWDFQSYEELQRSIRLEKVTSTDIYRLGPILIKIYKKLGKQPNQDFLNVFLSLLNSCMKLVYRLYNGILNKCLNKVTHKKQVDKKTKFNSCLKSGKGSTNYTE